ncbi:MAG: hypothetical protein ABIR47_14605 [Candidatus Kapaibacterium sp.]
MTETEMALSRFCSTPSVAVASSPPYVVMPLNSLSVWPVCIGIEDDATVQQQQRLRRRIQFLGELPANWDQRGAEAASELAVRLAKRFLSRVGQYRILPSAVGPSPEGGIMLEFRFGSRYFLLDIYNDGDIVFLREHENGDTRATEEAEGDIDRLVLELWAASAGSV